jgi:hypothetical protein
MIGGDDHTNQLLPRGSNGWTSGDLDYPCFGYFAESGRSTKIKKLIMVITDCICRVLCCMQSYAQQELKTQAVVRYHYIGYDVLL